jgi:uncharacterized protein YkwD
MLFRDDVHGAMFPEVAIDRKQRARDADTLRPMARVVRDLAVVVVSLGAIIAACGPRTRKGATTPTQGVATGTGTGTGAGTAVATGTGTGAAAGTGTGDGTTAEPPVLGPAWTPKGLTWPPGLPPIAIPAGFPTVIAPWPSVFPFPFPTTAPTSTPTSKPPTPPPPIANDGSPINALEDAVLAETNVRRAAGANCGGKLFSPAKPLAFHPALRASARGHSIDMANKGYFDHIGLDGSTPTDRMKAAGYDTKSGYTGENIAAGNATAKATVQQWMDSPGHCENIMDPHYTLLGVGYAFNDGNKYHHFWTQNFAGP